MSEKKPTSKSKKKQKTERVNVTPAVKESLGKLLVKFKKEETAPDRKLYEGDIVKMFVDGEAVKIAVDVKATLEELAESNKMKEGMVVSHLIAKFAESEVKLNEFIEYLEVQKKKVNSAGNRYGFLDDSKCKAFKYVQLTEEKGAYMCIWARHNKPPQFKKIAETEEGAVAYCLACDKTREIITGFVERDERIAELEAGLKAKATEVFKIPKCNAGGILSKDKEENMIFTGCRKSPSRPVSVDKFCRVHSNGLPCAMFAEVTVGVGTTR